MQSTCLKVLIFFSPITYFSLTRIASIPFEGDARSSSRCTEGFLVVFIYKCKCPNNLTTGLIN